MSTSTAAQDGPPELEVVRWYTAARRIPVLIGKTSRGERIWGGPYTPLQLVGGALVAGLGYLTAPWWGTSSLLGNVLLYVATVAGTVMFLGTITTGHRNLLALIRGPVDLASAPTLGTRRGRPVRLARPGRPVRPPVRRPGRTGEPAHSRLHPPPQVTPAGGDQQAHPSRTTPEPAPVSTGSSNTAPSNAGVRPAGVVPAAVELRLVATTGLQDLLRAAGTPRSAGPGAREGASLEATPPLPRPAMEGTS